jgi:hypothetical protein
MSNFPCGFLSESSGYYFYSAVLQANAAILSIVGVFIIFRIQRLQSTIDLIQNSFLMNLEKYATPEKFSEFFNSTLEKKKEVFEDLHYPNYIMSSLSVCIKNEETILGFNSAIKTPTLLLASGIILSTIGLFFTNFLHSTYGKTEFSLLLVFMIFEIVTIVFVVKTIFKIIKE